MGMVMREKYTAIQEPLLGLWKMLGNAGATLPKSMPRLIGSGLHWLGK